MSGPSAGAARQAGEDRGLVREPDRQDAVACLSLSGFHNVAFSDWGPLDADEVVVCVHGLTRQGRDFDILAARLADTGYRVVCPDLMGRGRSDRLKNTLDYVFPQYCADMGSLLAALGRKRVHWIGTSLGGLIGMVLASLPRSPISTLVLNDIGPEVPFQASARVARRLRGDPPSFDSMDGLIAHMRRIYVGCGPLTDAQWLHMARHSVRVDEESGRVDALIDPKIATAFQWLWYYSMSLWKYWRDLDIPVLAVHGADSDFVTPDVLSRMRRFKPDLATFSVPGTGHMPMLMSRAEGEAILSFLRAAS